MKTLIINQATSFFIIIVLFFSCSEKRKPYKSEKEEMVTSGLSGNELAIKHCGSCHEFVNPELLPKLVWKNNVLPAMGHRLGIFKGDHQPEELFDAGIGGTIIKKANIYPEQPVLARMDWEKIVDYYIESAPAQVIPPRRNKNIKLGLKHLALLREIVGKYS